MISPTIYDEKWYYSVELEPGKFTKGFDFKNIAATRNALDAIDVNGHSLIDLSTMEGMFATLLAKRGANVTATDTIDCSPRIALLKAAHGVNFKYLPHITLEDQAAFMFKQQSSMSYSPMMALKASTVTPWGYDVVLSSGVMYHILSPLHYFMQLRRMVKLGGLVVIETACAINDEIEMHHDYRHDNFVWGGSCSWFMSTGMIDLFFRACFMEPLGFNYVRSQSKLDLEVIRLGLVARAVETRPFDPKFMDRISKGEIVRSYDYKPLFEAAQLTGTVIKPVILRDNALHPVGARLTAEKIRTASEVNFKPDYLRLALGDR